MKDSTRREKLAKLLGLDTSPTATIQTDQKPTVAKQTRSRQAEATLAFVEGPQKFQRKQCRHCEATFYVDRANVALCSDRCRAKELEAVGIKWDWSKAPEARWYVISPESKATKEPLVVPPEAVAALETAFLLWGLNRSDIEQA